MVRIRYNRYDEQPIALIPTKGTSFIKLKKYIFRNRCFKWIALVATVFAILFALATIALAIVVGIKVNEDKDGNKDNIHFTLRDQLALNMSDDPHVQTSTTTPPKPLTAEEKRKLDWPNASGSLYAHFKKASIATDHGLCSEIGRDVMLEGGNSIDATIASYLCIGTVNPQSSGIGGGFLMTFYNATSKKCIAIDARETAPASATEDMFVSNPIDSLVGWKSIAVPGEIHGYWTIFKKFGSGKVTWKRLFEPSIHLAREGFPVSSNLAENLVRKEKEIMADDDMKKLFASKITGRVYEEGDIIKRVALSSTYQSLADSEDPVELFYRGGIAQTIATEIGENRGLVNLDDLKNFTTKIYDSPIEIDLELGGSAGKGLRACGPPPPSSFAITQSIIMIMSKFYNGEAKVDLDDPLVYHRLIEAEKFAYAQRTKLGDYNFVESARSLVKNMTNPDYAAHIAKLITDKAMPQDYYTSDMSSQVPDHGTSHIAAIDVDGNAVSCTSTINQLFGSIRVSPTLGIIWNDQMDDFSSPGLSNGFGFAPSPSNFIAPGKKPMSSMSPMIIYNKENGKVRMSVGASGGSFIISATAQTVIRTLLFNQTVKEAVDSPRIHNQFLPHTTDYENNVPKEIIEALVSKYGQNMTAIERQKSVVQVLEVKDDDYIYGNSDFRRATATYPAGF
uniref:Gamma-glutamyltranspeptidase 1 n=1 Tax=Rhabditophanes sp. KR3021 TaxID=114890 RepID=A0AC35TWZ4_9BILA